MTEAVTRSREELEAEIDRLAPFHHDVALPHGLRTHRPELAGRPFERTRVANLVRHAWPALLEECGGSLEGKRVLDVACNCGGFSIEAAKRGADYVLGVDVVDRYIEQGRFLKGVLGLENVDFERCRVEDLDEGALETFDVTFCFGLLYHLENPVLAMRKLSALTGRFMLVDTTVIRRPRSRKAIWHMNFPPKTKPDSFNRTTSLWRGERDICELVPNAKAVIELLEFVGFPNVIRIEPTKRRLEKRYYDETRVSFLAMRD